MLPLLHRITVEVDTKELVLSVTDATAIPHKPLGEETAQDHDEVD